MLPGLVVSCVLLWSGLVFSQATCEHDAKVLRCLEYLGNYDGDTAEVNIPNVLPFFGQKAKLRIAGIDTPEMRSQITCEKNKAIQAKTRVQQMLSAAKSLEIKSIERDKYFRIVGDLYADGQNVGAILIREGLAVPYDGGTKPKTNWCR